MVDSASMATLDVVKSHGRSEVIPERRKVAFKAGVSIPFRLIIPALISDGPAAHSTRQQAV